MGELAIDTMGALIGMQNLKMTSQQAMEALGIPQSEWVKYQQ